MKIGGTRVDDGTSAYFQTRFTEDGRRDDVWRRIASYLRRWIPPDASVADVGAGYCSLINALAAQRRVAVDLDDALRVYAAPGVEFVRASATNLEAFGEAEFDVVVASNLLEHLTRDEIPQALSEFRRILKPRGTLLLVQPNYRLCSARYFDDYTHVTPLSDVSLTDILRASGYAIVRVEPRFMPFTLKSRLGGLSRAIPFYLRLPWRPFAGQMLVIARRN
jgi:SAM-dependent methyltransferase